ncbi:MAG: CHASE2 domain-containing protein [Candidatus Marinimicrobia bacterium]|jgi:adenylate cyclase|nr:CHASE2 domain-containing protein [Candidatus Neomarinimicrobiota bacterium]MDP7059166.1 CHASE2 domain-containing protein [Candidatus Neomarinimicrobiota bacterium]|tara:strand:+ start:5221 stop:7701 length:2481 start_codon:yes stop_codon:yes gene_type:complete
MNTILELLKKQAIGLSITLGSLFLVFFLHRIHAFDTFELKAMDLAFKTRGPISGWSARDELPKDSLDVVLVDVDDESYRLVPWTWPYPRGVWGMVVRNLSKAGAKVIAFDIQFDAPDRQSEYLKEIRSNLQARGLGELVPAHGDSVFAEAIREVQSNGTSVILASKLVQEPTRMPPQYIQFPNPVLLTANADYGLVNEAPDKDGFSRQYYTFLQLEQEPGVWYPSLGVKAIQKFLDVEDNVLPSLNEDATEINYGPLTIPIFSNDGRFLVNIYGPPSGVNLGENEAWKTFNRYPLSNVVDVEEVDLSDFDEDTDWMSQFLPGEIPQWLKEIEDPETKTQLMEELGLGTDFDITQSPFYNKIVLIGVSVEVLHDYKQTSFFTFAGEQNLMPGVEFHANAIQTLLNRNFISVYGGEIDWSEQSRSAHILLITGLSLLAYLAISFMNPLLAGLFIVVEILVFLSLAIGSFTADFLWLVKTVIGKGGSISVPGFQDSTLVPVVAPIFGIFIVYTSNVLYRIIVEQKDKQFLKNTFGTYVSPDLIDQMYDSKQEPKLGGQAGYHTAFFSDIQSFSAFSEVLEPERMVALMNEYLTEMTDILLDHRATLDKYIGDAIVAFYGAPVPVDDHEYLACITSLAMENHLSDLRQKWAESGDWPDIVPNMRHRVGLNSGDMVTGNMGSNMRMNYTMMGDTVNIAARLEASAKQYGIYIQVAENTYNAVKDEFEWRFLDNVRVKGKTQPVKVFELLAEKGKLSEEYSKLIPVFNEGINFYLKQKWDKGLKAFNEAETMEEMFPTRPTNPSAVYIERCEYLKENPPGDDWDGVWTLTQK